MLTLSGLSYGFNVRCRGKVSSSSVVVAAAAAVTVAFRCKHYLHFHIKNINIDINIKNIHSNKLTLEELLQLLLLLL